jgi:hypothetical protein
VRVAAARERRERGEQRAMRIASRVGWAADMFTMGLGLFGCRQFGVAIVVRIYRAERPGARGLQPRWSLMGQRSSGTPAVKLRPPAPLRRLE